MTNNLPKGCRLIPLTTLGDERGRLVAIEGASDVPFAIARVYYIYATTTAVTRGLHAHRTLTQLAVAVTGRCTMMLDDGANKKSVLMDDPAVGLIVPAMVWHEMSDFSPDCVLMVLADAAYDEADYIRSYSEFRTLATA